MRKQAGALSGLASSAFVLALALVLPAPEVSAQWSSAHAQAPLTAPHNGEFRERYAVADGLLNAIEYAGAARYETLWTEPAASPARLEAAEYTRVTADLLHKPPRLPSSVGILAPAFSRSVPEAAAMIDWAEGVTRQAYDALAAGGPQQDGRIAELVAYYRSRPDLAVSAKPKSVDALDAQFYSLAFRRRYPNFNGLMWASRWLEFGLYEALVVAESTDDRARLTDAALLRFRSMVQNPPETMPYLMPLSPVVAPAFAQRYPELAAVLDNKHMLQDVLADIMVSREVPASARRQEIRRAASLFRSDTAFATAYGSWIAMRTAIGAHNMGGTGVGFGEDPAAPTVVRGMSLAGAVPRLRSSAAAMPGMQHGATPAAMPQGHAGMAMQETTRAQSMDVIMSVYDRMLQDPVIRERVATDPVIQSMLAGTPAGGQSGGMMNMPGMNMPGMTMTTEPMTEERKQAVEFIVRLLSDPSVAARIHGDPELHALWSDPDVQRRLSELRSLQPAPSQARQPRPNRQAPPPPPPPTHRH